MELETYELPNGYQIVTYYDEHPCNPREEWDNVTTLVGWHRHYELSDPKVRGDFPSPEHFCEWLKEEREDGKEYIVRVVYAYEHGGIMLQCSAFSDPWDSGQVGFVFVSKEKARQEWPAHKDESEDEWLKRIKGYIDGEIETFSDYLNGSVYGYEVFDNNGEPTDDSCWGYYGFQAIDDAVEEVRSYHENNIPEPKPKKIPFTIQWRDPKKALPPWVESDFYGEGDRMTVNVLVSYSDIVTEDIRVTVGYYVERQALWMTGQPGTVLGWTELPEPYNP